MNQNKIPIREVITIAVGETAVAAAVCAVFLMLGKYDYTVLLGALLGGVVTVLNFLFLCVTVNRAVDRCLEGFDPSAQAEPPTDVAPEVNVDGEEETDEPDDAAARFAKENAGKLQNTIKLSYVIRTVTVIAALVIAFITKQFNVIATVIPLLCLRPILTVAGIIKGKEKR